MRASRHIWHLGSETIIYGIPGTINRFIAIFLVPIYTRVFSTTEYGVYGTLTSLTQLLATFVVLGLDNASARWFYDTENIDRRKSVIASWFWCQFLVSLLLALVVTCLAAPVARLLLGSDEYAVYLRLAVWVIPLMASGRVLGNWMRYRRLAWMNVGYSVAASLVVVACIILMVVGLGKGLAGLYQGQLLGWGIMMLVAAALFLPWIHPRRFSWKLLREMFAFGLPLVPAGLASWVTASSDRVLMTMFRGAAENGIYYAGVQIALGMALLTSAFQLAWGPFAFSILNEPEAPRVYSKVFSLYCFLGCWLGLGMSLFGPLLLSIFTTPEYYGASSCIPFLVFGNLAMTATYIGVLGPSIEKKSGPIAVSIFIGAGLNLGLNLALIPLLGKEGAALTTWLAYGAAAVYIFYRAQKIHPLPYRFRDALVCLVVAALLIAADQIFLPVWAGWAFA
ncbi:MAG: lipopolysaccharide biosynthesis protein, partial [Chloroflexia bacterium]